MLLLGLGWCAQASPLRDQYRQAEQALEQGKVNEYRQLRSGLDAYPLVPYLDYRYLADRLNHIGTQDVRGL
ncbi:hypothetical protein MBH78_12585 [Oceanimonas sp. NS1]|nr:hypothetical protein [Oceanimonas sp. NS1]